MTKFSTQTPAAHNPLDWVKTDLHLHSREDPYDQIDYSALDLLERAYILKFRVVAITLHDKVLDDPQVFSRAQELGILLISAAELRIEGADVVLLNISREEANAVRSFEDLRTLRNRRGDSLLTFAPHPFYRFGGSIGQRIPQYLDCFDAIEHCHFHIPVFNPNRQAARLAERTGLPLLATSDAHRLKFFGQNYSFLRLPIQGAKIPEIAAVFHAIRTNSIRRIAPTGGWGRLIEILFFIFLVHPILVLVAGSKHENAGSHLSSDSCQDEKATV